MKKPTIALFIALVFCCGLALGENWLTDGGDLQRSGWNKDEKTLSKDNINTMKLLWKIDTGNGARALHSLMTPLVVDSVPTSSGPKQIVYVVGSSDNLYAVDAKTGKMVWQRHFTYPAATGPANGGFGGPEPLIPSISAFCAPAALQTFL